MYVGRLTDVSEWGKKHYKGHIPRSTTFACEDTSLAVTFYAHFTYDHNAEAMQ